MARLRGDSDAYIRSLTHGRDEAQPVAGRVARDSPPPPSATASSPELSPSGCRMPDDGVQQQAHPPARDNLVATQGGTLRPHGHDASPLVARRFGEGLRWARLIRPYTAGMRRVHRITLLDSIGVSSPTAP
jgi:hypothetical protein